MSKIISLRGTDGGCGCSGGIGDATDTSSAAPAVVTDPPMTATTILVWIAAIGTVGYIFWGTLQPPKRRRAA